MRKYISGYNTIDLTSNDVYTQALNACVLTNKKPTFIYDGSNVSIINTIVLNDDNTITINGELVINTDNTLTPSDWKIHAPSSTSTPLYILTFYFENNSFFTYVNDKGVFELDTAYDFADSGSNYKLTDEQTTSLLSILDKIKVGTNNGIGLIQVLDYPMMIFNKSTNTVINFVDGDNLDVVNINLSTKQVVAINNNDWYIKITQLI